jgi:hypothetical protein
MLARYRPVEDGAVRWIDSADDARAVARFTGRPLFVYARFSECPMCRQMDGTTLRDPSFLESVAAFVPLRVDVATLPQAEARRLLSAAWPHFEVDSPAGTRVREFGGMLDAAAMRRELAAAPAPDASPTTWDAARDAASRWAAAAEARGALLAARAAPEARAADARARLEEAARKLAGTPFGEDLARVLERWKELGAFPDLVEAKR